jgi:hypothetical protein
VVKGSDLCLPCPKSYYGAGGPPGYSWCELGKTPPAPVEPPSPTPVPPSPAPGPPSPDGPSPCDIDGLCPIGQTCNENNECLDNTCADDPTICIDTSDGIKIGACDGETCVDTCSAEGPTCPSPTVCSEGTCVSPPDGSELFTDCTDDASCADPTFPFQPFCGTFGTESKCAPCWLAPSDFCDSVETGSTCQSDGSCSSAARKGGK